MKIFTIGHSSQTFESFLTLLREHAISAIADVRSSPYSSHAPQFNTGILRESLKGNEISYVFMGAELGARSNDRSCYVGNTVSYKKLAKTSLFRKGIQRVEEGSKRFKVALMCSERDPTECHRTILVSKVLEKRGAEINHILCNGDLEPHRATMLRVLDILGMPREDMLHSQDELIEQAYEGREKQVAYRREG